MAYPKMKMVNMWFMISTVHAVVCLHGHVIYCSVFIYVNLLHNDSLTKVVLTQLLTCYGFLTPQEMKLLAEVDKPGSQIDNYVTQLSFVLSRKAAGLVSLQARLARFQHRLKEQEILSRKRVPR